MLEESLSFTAMAVAFNPLPVLIIGVDPYIKNGGAWRFAVTSSI
jgi:uracil DNA glycosylase